MTKRQETQMLNQLNRSLIAILSLIGLLLDGGQFADLVLETAAILWLWSSELRALEAALLRRMQIRRVRQ